MQIGVDADWRAIRKPLAWTAQITNLADLVTTFVAMAAGGREVGIVPHLLISRGYPAIAVVLVIKGVAGWPLDTSWRRIGVLAGIGGMTLMAILFAWVAAHNAA